MKSLLITFHASHNHGSALQAYATQQLLRQVGCNNTILNFQMPAQKKYYSLYGGKGGMKLRELAMLPLHFQRRRRQKRFVEFQKNYFSMTAEVNSYEQINQLDLKKFDLLVSGADQIWSDQIPEFKQSAIDYKGIYFGDFINCRKISFGSSTGEAGEEYLKSQLENLKKYDSIAVREESGEKILNSLLDISCDVVLDPTLLLTKEEYSKQFNINKPIVKEKYIFLYTLQGVKSGLKWKKMLQNLKKSTGYKVVVASPFFPIIGRGIVNLNDVGPLEYINLIKYAEIVLTDSFHGTAFSTIFRKNFFVFQSESSHDPRKKNLLTQFGLQKRIIHQQDANLVLQSNPIRYEEELIESKIDRSKRILERYVNE